MRRTAIALTTWLALFPSESFAAPITFDPGAYDGVYSVTSAPGSRSGVTTLDLAPGPHLLIIGPDGAYVPLNVAADGSVSTTNPGAATTMGSTLMFNTTTVVIDPGAYTGRFFSANRLSTARTGVTSLTLVRNLLTYVAMGGVGTGSDVVFRVEANGDVTPVSPAGAATSVGSTLVIATHDITFDPGDYVGDYFVQFGAAARRGVTSAHLPLGVLDYVEVGGRGIGGVIGFRVDPAGAITIVAPLTAAHGGDRLVSFENRVVEFLPGAYGGTYSLAGHGELALVGSTAFTLVPGLRSYVEVGTRGGGALMAFSVRPDGLQMVTPNVALTSAFELAFLTQEIVVTPQGHANAWTPLGYGSGIGERTVAVVPALPMYLQVGPNAGSYVVSPGASCTIAPPTLTVSGSSFGLACASPPPPDSDGDGVPDDVDQCPLGDDAMDLDGDGTADACDACPSDFFNDSDGDGSCDSADLCPVDPMNDEDLDGLCADADPCPRDPEDDVDADGVCGDVDACPDDPTNDADGDGTCGADDTCPGGDDHLDADGDGTADACDLCPTDPANDADADGLCGDIDPCPLDPANDADGDHACAGDDPCPLDPEDDGDGDGACADVDPCPFDVENDADGDGVCEVADNCPTLANANQSDVDGDGIGDACETDEDDDGIVNDQDNCPLDVNPTQADADGDGAGDVCDLDDDGDGVLDVSDVCLATPVGAPTLQNGCAIAQECACAAPWKNHGGYVRCVTHAANNLAAAGKVSESERSALVSQAAQSQCGK